MIRNWVRFVTMLMVFTTASVWALGLGEITLHSHLNENLDADIELLATHPDELDSIKASLASPKDFEMLGVDRAFFLTTLIFEPKLDKKGKPVIHISTKEPIKEPFLDLVLEVNWPKGRLLKEYTTLVDPPLFAQEAPKPVKQAETKPKESVAREPSAPKAVYEPADDEKFPRIPIKEEPVAFSGDSYGPTKRTDTLWSIANEVKPNNDVSIDQVMHALVRKNPEAFYGQNINAMKAGYVLRVPEVDEITAISKSEARSLSRQQYEDWKNRKAEDTQISTPMSGEGAQTDAPAVSGMEDGPRLKLLTPEEEAVLTSKPGTDKAGTGSDMVDTGGAGTGADATDDAMRTRIQDLESQLSELREALAVKDEELATFKQEMPVQPAITAQQESQPEAPAMEEPKAEAKPEAPKPAPVAKPKPAPKPQVETGLMDDLLNSPLMLAGVIAVILILGAVIWMVIGKRRVGNMRMNFHESILTGGSKAAAAGAAAGATAEKSADSSFLSEFSVSGIEGIQTEVSEVDPIAEADVYLAYGGYKQAEDLIRDALASDPGRAELKVKLLEIYQGSGNSDAFQALAEEFYASLGGQQSPLWDKVVDMGRSLCPENPLFGSNDSGSFADSESSASSDELSLDLPEEDTASSSDDELTLDLPEEDSSLDLDLGESTYDEADSSLDMSFDSDTSESTMSFDSDTAETAEEETSELSLDEDALSFDTDTVETEESTDDLMSFDSETVEAPAEEEPSMEFDMGEASTEEEPISEFSMDDLEDVVSTDDLNMEAEEETHTPGPETMFEDSAVDGGLYTEEDEVGTKLDLAKAYIDMGDPDGARSILEEVLEEGNDTQKHEASDLMNQIQQ